MYGYREHAEVVGYGRTAGNRAGQEAGFPDETRQFVDKGKADIVHLGNVSVGRFVLEPGWRWSEHVKPIAGTE